MKPEVIYRFRNDLKLAGNLSHAFTPYTRWFKYDRDWFVCKQAALLLRSAACLHTNQSRSYLNHLVSSQSILILSSYRSLSLLTF